jgi:hypothetical protein
MFDFFLEVRAHAGRTSCYLYNREHRVETYHQEAELDLPID